jgi:hypothetical protein
MKRRAVDVLDMKHSQVILRCPRQEPGSAVAEELCSILDGHMLHARPLHRLLRDLADGLHRHIWSQVPSPYSLANTCFLTTSQSRFTA